MKRYESRPLRAGSMAKIPRHNKRPWDSTVESTLRRQICETGRSMYESGFVVATEGNLSVRVGSDRILLTPTGVCEGRLISRDLLLSDLNGTVSRGTGVPSSEILMHLLFYRLRPDVCAVCHAHPPAATGFAVAGRALNVEVLREVVFGLGEIPLAPYGTPGTDELCESLEPFVARYNAVLLQNHGVVTCGQDLATAYQRLETVEQFARIQLAAHSAGGSHVLSSANVRKLVATEQLCGASYPADRREFAPDPHGPNRQKAGRPSFSVARASSRTALKRARKALA